MIIKDFTRPEIEYLRENCNFVGDEIYLFDARSRGISIERIAEDLNVSVSTAKAISCKVNKKINKINTF